MLDDEDSVYMIRHDNEFVEHDALESFWNTQPNIADDFSYRVDYTFLSFD